MCCQIDLIRPGGATHPSPFEQKTLFWWLSKFPIKGKPCITSCAIHFVSRRTLFAAQWCSIIAVHVRPLSPLQCLETRTDEESRSILGEEPASQVFLPQLTSHPSPQFYEFSSLKLEKFGRQSLQSDLWSQPRDEGETTDGTQGHQVHWQSVQWVSRWPKHANQHNNWITTELCIWIDFYSFESLATIDKQV